MNRDHDRDYRLRMRWFVNDGLGNHGRIKQETEAIQREGMGMLPQFFRPNNQRFRYMIPDGRDRHGREMIFCRVCGFRMLRSNGARHSRRIIHRRANILATIREQHGLDPHLQDPPPREPENYGPLDRVDH